MYPSLAAPNPPAPPRQPNKYFSVASVYISQPGSFLDACNYVVNWVFPFGPAGSQQASVPTHWQALDLEFTAVIVIYASSDDSCAHIVSSIWLRHLKVIVQLRLNHRIFPRKWNCHRTSQLIQSDHKGLLLHAVTDGIQSLHSSKPRRGHSMPGKYQARTQSSTRGHFWVRAQCSTLH